MTRQISRKQCNKIERKTLWDIEWLTEIKVILKNSILNKWTSIKFLFRENIKNFSNWSDFQNLILCSLINKLFQFIFRNELNHIRINLKVVHKSLWNFDLPIEFLRQWGTSNSPENKINIQFIEFKIFRRKCMKNWKIQAQMKMT